MKPNQRRRKKKHKSQPSKPAKEEEGEGNPKPTEEPVGIGSIADAFGSVTLEEAEGNSETAAVVLRAYLSDNTADSWTSSSSNLITGSDLGMASTSDSGSGRSEWLSESNRFAETGNPSRRTNKAKRLVAATGTVSTVLGKDYMKLSPKKAVIKPNVFSNRVIVNECEETEQFLMSMLGDECDLSLAVVRDVLCQCGYNLEKALDVLLDMSVLSDECAVSNKSLIDDANNREDSRFAVSSDENLADRESECTSNSCDSEFQDSIWMMGNNRRNYSESVSEIQSTTCRAFKSNVSQEVLESFYKIYRSPQHELRTMNWRNIAKKMSSFNGGIDLGHNIAEPPKGEQYVLHRKEAQQHWDSMKTAYQKAATAYSKGEKSYAAFLSDQGKKFSRMGREADERASHEIFRARNKSIENLITIDLHGQHVKEARRLLKFHLLLPSIQKLRVITGCGSHGAGKSKLKQMVTRLAKEEGIQCIEENQGTVVLKLDQPRDFSFLDSDSNSD